MSKVLRMCLAGVAALVVPLASQAAAADGAPAAAAEALPTTAVQSAAPVAQVQAVAPVTTGARANLMGMEPLDTKVLAKKRGAADVFNDMQLKGVVADNRAINVTTGHNLITEGSFAGSAGMPMVVQNSGNNVLIQNATILNIQVK